MYAPKNQNTLINSQNAMNYSNIVIIHAQKLERNQKKFFSWLEI